MVVLISELSGFSHHYGSSFLIRIVSVVGGVCTALRTFGTLPIAVPDVVDSSYSWA